jgi:two-component system sensor histidine kinase RegB
MAPILPRDAEAITLAWLVRLRWGAALGQAATVAVAVGLLGLELPLLPLSALIGVTLASNLGLSLWLKSAAEVSAHVTGLVLSADTLVLTLLLAFSGGPSNPFSVFYLVHVTLAAVALGKRWALSIVLTASACFGLLFAWHVPLPGMEHAHHHGGEAFSVHLQGMWLAFTVAAALIATFVAALAASLRERERELQLARELASSSEKLAALSTLSAGAAHELGTPLSTIAIVARELERSLEHSLAEDARLIRQEVERCRLILQRMGAQAGELHGEVPERLDAGAVLEKVKARLAESSPHTLDTQVTGAPSVYCSPEGLVQVLLNLVQNAVQASPPDEPVQLSVEAGQGTVRFVCGDRGHGIAEAALPRVGEPFFTTKPTGQGMGLGVFLAKAFATRHGGTLRVSSEPGRGTVVTLELAQAQGERPA